MSKLIIATKISKLRICPNEIAIIFRDTPVAISNGSNLELHHSKGKIVVIVGKCSLAVDRKDLADAVAVVPNGSVTDALDAFLCKIDLKDKS